MGYVLGAVIGVAAGVAPAWVALGGGGGHRRRPRRRGPPSTWGWVSSSSPSASSTASSRACCPTARQRRGGSTRARDLMRAVSARRERISDAAVLREIDDLLRDIEALVACVEAQPSTYRRLAHFLSTYRDQCVRNARRLPGRRAPEHARARGGRARGRHRGPLRALGRRARGARPRDGRQGDGGRGLVRGHPAPDRDGRIRAPTRPPTPRRRRLRATRRGGRGRR